jgi:hypothetical protein
MPAKDEAAEHPFPKERQQFLPLLLSNPNYFGTLKNSPYKQVVSIAGNTSYEELKCVGFQPQINRLEGVVWVKRPSGYGGGICTNGSREYVSFFLSYDNGATWLPQGTTSFPVYDVPGPHPLEYAVSIVIEPHHKFCFTPNLPLVRAILSWSVPPSGPGFVPVWGNIVEARIQIGGFMIDVPLAEVLEAAKLELPSEVAAQVDPTTNIKLQAPRALTAGELASLYAKTNVPAHRFLNSTIQQALAHPVNLAATTAQLSAVGVDVSKIIGAAQNVNGSTEYEQLECIGLDEGTGSPDALVGTLVVKLPTGYLGNPCTAGSKEYVAFWIDWGKGWEWAGTASVNVYDIGSIPKEGLRYAVYQPVNLNPHRKPCDAGPVEAKMRAILSWDMAPPSFDPNYVPVWGNRLETLILVNPGTGAQPGDFTPILTSICDVAVCDIDQKSGWAYPGAGDRPFGDAISIFGIIPGAPLFTWPLPAQPKYQVTVQQLIGGFPVGAPQILTDPFNVTVYRQIGGGPITSFNLTENAVGGYFTYQDLTANPGQGWQSISPLGLLAVWSSAPNTGTWQITVTAWDATLTTMYVAGTTVCTLDGTSRQGVVIDLDQAAPVTDLKITGYMPGGVGTCQPAADCQTFTVGDVICGTYGVSDEHLGGFSLEAEPTPSPTANFTIDGVAGNGLSYPNPALPLAGTKTGNWTYDTAGLPACGYTIQMFSNDRTIVDCVTDWQNNSKFVGFCLVLPGAKK